MANHFLIVALGFLISQLAFAKPYQRVGTARAKPRVEKQYEHGVGVEIGAGNYNGVTFMKHWDRTKYIQGMVGFRLFQSQLLGTSDFIMSYPRLLAMVPDVTLYYGGGIILVMFDEFESLLGTEDDQHQYIGFRIPTGAKMDLDLFDLPFHVYAEATPGITFLPLGRPFFGVTLGARYLF